MRRVWIAICLTAAMALLATVPAVARFAPSFQRGAVLTAFNETGYLGMPVTDTLEHLSTDVHADNVAIIVTEFMDRCSSSKVGPDNHLPFKNIPDAALISAIQAAKAKAFRVTLKPQVDVREGSPRPCFRGDIHPRSVGDWFASYRAFIGHYADLAQANDVDMLVVGTELTSLQSSKGYWFDVINDARARFRGELTYAANWDAFADIEWWGALDYIGIDAYFPLAKQGNPSPSVEKLEAAWKTFDDGYRVHHYVHEIRAVHEHFNKPVLFTEIGYRDREGTARKPYAGLAGKPVSEQAQRSAYDAALQVWSEQPWLVGMYWWNYDAQGSAPAGDYSPRGKLAEAGLAVAYSPPPPPPGP